MDNSKLSKGIKSFGKNKIKNERELNEGKEEREEQRGEERY